MPPSLFSPYTPRVGTQILLIDLHYPVEANVVHLSGTALLSTEKGGFDIFTALGLDGPRRFSMNILPM